MGRYLGRFTGLVLVAMFVWSTAASAQWTWSPQTKRWVNVKRMAKETPELQYEYARSFFVKKDYDKALRETERFFDYYGESDFADNAQFLRAEIFLADGKDVRASKEFQKVITAYPSSELYEQAIVKQYEIGDRLYDQGEKKAKRWWPFFKRRPYKKAIQVYAQVVQNQPFADVAAEAQYKLGLCHHKRKEYIEAAYEYRRVQEDYGTSKWVPDASYQLAKCYSDASLPAAYDQSPTELSLNAIAEFKGRFPDDSRVAELDGLAANLSGRVAEQKLATARFHEKRREFDSARVTYEVLAEQYSNTPSGVKAREWLNKNPGTIKSLPAPDAGETME